jgi:D-glycero-D-manno-heptose 1,7-bisphosphate phosphatase
MSLQETAKSTSVRALFLDRDGVINYEVGYLYRPEETRFVDGIFPLCRAAQGLGYRLVIVTNQAGIARGYYGEEDFHALMDWMRAQLQAEGIEINAVYFCPDHPEHGIGRYKRESDLRKPAPGMLLRAAAEFGLDLQQSIFIGDRCSDVAAGNAAPVGTMFLLAGTEQQPCPGNYTPIASLTEAEEWLRAKG